MKKDWSHLEKWRIKDSRFATPKGVTYGVFEARYNGVILQIIATDGEAEEKGAHCDWEHVSCKAYDPVFKKYRIPKWEEMCFVKSQFWNEDETVVEYHPAKSNYVNIHDCVLHLWRWKKGEFPTPPTICV